GPGGCAAESSAILLERGGAAVPHSHEDLGHPRGDLWTGQGGPAGEHLGPFCGVQGRPGDCPHASIPSTGSTMMVWAPARLSSSRRGQGTALWQSSCTETSDRKSVV